MAEYCTDDDLLLIRPDILSLGVLSWDDQIIEAGKILDRTLESAWYRKVAENKGIDYRVTPFDRDLLLAGDNDQLLRVGSYKSLELAYMYLMKNRPDDAFDKLRITFRTLYKDELEEILISGVNYDFNDDDEIDPSERIQPQIRRLERV